MDSTQRRKPHLVFVDGSILPCVLAAHSKSDEVGCIGYIAGAQLTKLGNLWRFGREWIGSKSLSGKYFDRVKRYGRLMAVRFPLVDFSFAISYLLCLNER